MIQLFSFTFLFIFCLPILSAAHVVSRVTEPAQLMEPVPEVVKKVETARILIADYNLIRSDFPETNSFSENQIDQWLLKYAAFVSRSQAHHTDVNTKIKIQMGEDFLSIRTTAFRPQAYGRSLVFKVPGGMIDGKGHGSEYKPSNESHRDGLATLTEAIREYNMQKKVQQILDHSGSGLQTVECYAVIDWGFDAINKKLGTSTPAGSVLRQAHSRKRIQSGGNHFAEFLDTMLIEKLLRSYGITATGDSSTDKMELINIQVTATGELVDFGSYIGKDHFTIPASLYAPQLPLISQKSAAAHQPHPRLVLPMSHWGSSESGESRARYDNPWIWAERLALDVRAKKSSEVNVRQHHQDMMNAGRPPEDLKGIFKDSFSHEAQKKALIEVLELNANQNLSFVLYQKAAKLLSVTEFEKLIADYLQSEKIKPWFDILLVNLAEAHPEALLKFLQHPGWGKYPEVLEQPLIVLSQYKQLNSPAVTKLIIELLENERWHQHPSLAAWRETFLPSAMSCQRLLH